MTAVNYVTSPKAFKSFSENPKASEVLQKLLTERFAQAIVGTPDMQVDGTDLNLESPEGMERAISMMDVNVVPLSHNPKCAGLYLPTFIVEGREEITSKVAELLACRPVLEQPIVSDKGVVAFRTQIGYNLEEMNEQIKRIVEDVTGNRELIFEAVNTGTDNPLFNNVGVVLEGIDKDHRVDPNGNFQKHFRNVIPGTKEIISSDNPKIDFNFTPPIMSHHIFPE